MVIGGLGSGTLIKGLNYSFINNWDDNNICKLRSSKDLTHINMVLVCWLLKFLKYSVSNMFILLYMGI